MSGRMRSALHGLALLTGAGLLAVAAWAATPYGPDERALDALRTSDGISVERTGWGWEFAPSASMPATAVVVYPGGHVDPRSYAPLARSLAQAGYRAIVIKMPLSLAVMAPNAADRAVRAHPEIRRWAIVGHSLGGAMAAAHAARRPGRYSALVLLAAYPPESVDLSRQRMAVAAFAGSEDTVLNRARFDAMRGRLPQESVIATVEGANHAQWGAYGRQRGDGDAHIAPEVQTAIAVDAVRRVLGDLPPLEEPATPGPDTR
ncbi:MAG: alpha/beta hydrolase [Coriobacteriia bacterium]|nr:alpha/beta hydrolase [Coriobacteriia bacterium]